MKKYTSPTTGALDMNGREMLALSVVDGGADGSEVLAGKKGWSSEGWSDGEDYWNEAPDDSQD